MDLTPPAPPCDARWCSSSTYKVKGCVPFYIYKKKKLRKLNKNYIFISINYNVKI